MNGRERHTPWNRNTVEFIETVRSLKERGYIARKIAERENCGKKYIDTILCLLKRGCPPLLEEAGKGRIPHTVAIQIARAKNPEIQRILVDGFKARTVNCIQIIAIRQRIEEHERENSGSKQGVTDAVSISRQFSKEAAKQRQLIQKAELAKWQLAFIADAFKKLLSEGEFVALVYAAGVPTVPTWLAKHIKKIELNNVK